MEITVIKIGNSKGIRLAKTILDKYGIQDKIEVILKEGYLILKPVHSPRSGWDSAFKEMNKNGEDKLFIDDVFEDEDFGE